MKKKIVLLSDIISLLGEELITINGEINQSDFIDNITDADHTVETSLDWIGSNKKNKQQIVELSPARVIIVDKDVEYSDRIRQDRKILLVTKKPKTAIAIIGNFFFCENTERTVHSSAIIDESAVIGKNVSIGPFSIIGNAIIGDNCIIGANVHICDDCVLGNNCKVSDNVIIGDAGFGFIKDKDNWFRFPQIGGVIIGEGVEIGPFTSIDRGALSDTVIGDNTKIDSHCKIAHNNTIGRNVIITGCCSIAGSNVIEDDVWIGPNSSLKDWGYIGKGAFIGMGSVVVTKVKPYTRVFGNPAKRINIE